LSAIVITRNEEANIGPCLDALAFCDERIVVDAGSTDRTVALARERGARVETHDWQGFGAQKNFALSLAQGDWVLSVDADERVSPALAGEIERTIADRRAGSAGGRWPPAAGAATGFPACRASSAARCAIRAGFPTTCCACFAAAGRASPTTSCTSGWSARARSDASPSTSRTIRSRAS